MRQLNILFVSKAFCTSTLACVAGQWLLFFSEIAQRPVAHNMKFQLFWNLLLVLDARSSRWFELTFAWPSLRVSLGRGPSHLMLALQMFGSHPGSFTAGEREQHLQRVTHLPQQIFIFRWDALPFVHISLSVWSLTTAEASVSSGRVAVAVQA